MSEHVRMSSAGRSWVRLARRELLAGSWSMYIGALYVARTVRLVLHPRRVFPS